jgi:dihydrolipoyl dehydrogenase
LNSESESTQVAVIGAGPGGYAAAFRAADLGLQVTLIDLEENPGGVCQYRGCIPSKALLHAARVIVESREASDFGVEFQDPKIDLAKLSSWKEGIVQKLTGNLGILAKQRKIRFIRGRASFLDSKTLTIQEEGNHPRPLSFEYAILATGSRPSLPSDLAVDSPHLWNSTTALELREIPKSMLIVGGGYIGLELGTVYATLGTKVSLVEMTEGLLPGVDRDLVRVLSKRVEALFSSVAFQTKVVKIQEDPGGLKLTLEDSEGKQSEAVFGKVLVSVGRKPNSSGLGLSNTSVEVDGKGFVKVDAERRTNVPHLFAIGDLAGEPMLAHKATHEGMVAAEVIAGQKAIFEPRAIPAVVYTDPEIAWCGLTEAEAKKQNRKVTVSRFPWGASGRAMTLNRTDGVTKILVDPETDRVLGVGIVGSGAGELIAEGVLAVEMGATSSDLKLSIHPHPTLTETLMEAAEGVEGLGLHLFRLKR